MKEKMIVLAALFIMVLSNTYGLGYPYEQKDLLKELIQLNDIGIPNALNHQWTDKNAPYYGAAFDADSVVSPIRTADLLESLICSYVSPESKYYQSNELLERMTIATLQLIALQHEDGTIDLIATNFHSTPDLGFVIFPMSVAYSIITKHDNLNYGELPSLMKKFMLKAGEALSVGGIHTPNHRWVVCAALSWLNNFFPNPRYVERIQQWLDEKIDLDPDGQYNERSTGGYSPHIDKDLVYLARNLHYDYIYDYVRKNLDMTFFFVRSNGEIATESSRRQDQYRVVKMTSYYISYLYMALHDKSSRYSGMVDYIEKTVPVDQLGGMLSLFIEDPSLLGELPSPEHLPEDYHKYFAYSDMVRIREGDTDMSIITGNASFFSYFKGNAALEAVRLSSAFFGKGQFESQKMEKVGDTYILSASIKGPYYQPIPKDELPTQDGDWNKMPKSMRIQSEVQTLDTKIYISEKNGKATIKVSMQGPNNLPVSLELCFRKGGTLNNVTNKAGIPDAYLIKNGEYATYSKDGQTIKVGSGICSHKWTQLRGALPKLTGESLYFTNYAPCEFEFTIE